MYVENQKEKNQHKIVTKGSLPAFCWDAVFYYILSSTARYSFCVPQQVVLFGLLAARVSTRGTVIHVALIESIHSLRRLSTNKNHAALIGSHMFVPFLCSSWMMDTSIRQANSTHKKQVIYSTSIRKCLLPMF